LPTDAVSQDGIVDDVVAGSSEMELLVQNGEHNNSCDQPLHEHEEEWAVVEVKRKKRSQVSSDTREEVGSSSHASTQQAASPSIFKHAIEACTKAAAPARMQRQAHHQLVIGIEDDSDFHLVRRLLGPGGENMERIRGEHSGIKVELRGTGSRSVVSNAGPLTLHIKGSDDSQCAGAHARATELLAEIRQEYESFLASRQSSRDALSSAKVEMPCDNLDSQEESTSADDSTHLNDATDSDSDLTMVKVQVPAESEDKVAGLKGGQKPEHTDAKAATRMKSVHHGCISLGVAIHHEVPVGIKHTSQFPIVRKLIGPGGENMRSISNACPGTKVELRGSGTNPWNGGESGPLVLHIRGHDQAQCTMALKRANSLVEKVRKEHQLFLDTL
jgi:hypothetical protein